MTTTRKLIRFTKADFEDTTDSSYGQNDTGERNEQLRNIIRDVDRAREELRNVTSHILEVSQTLGGSSEGSYLPQKTPTMRQKTPVIFNPRYASSPVDNQYSDLGMFIPNATSTPKGATAMDYPISPVSLQERVDNLTRQVEELEKEETQEGVGEDPGMIERVRARLVRSKMLVEGAMQRINNMKNRWGL